MAHEHTENTSNNDKTNNASENNIKLNNHANPNEQKKNKLTTRMINNTNTTN